MMQNYFGVSLLLLSVFIINCEGKKHINKDSVEGCWKKQIGQEVYTFNFEKVDSNSYQGTVSTYRNGEKMDQTQLKNISFKNYCLSMITNPKAGIFYRGTLDTSRQVINGMLHYKNGSTYDFNLVRCQNIKDLKTNSGHQTEGFEYKLIEDLPQIQSLSLNEVRSDYRSVMESIDESDFEVEDAVTVIGRRHGEIYPSHPERNKALLLSFLLDPLIEEISDCWKDRIKNKSTFEDKISAINEWNIQHMAYTQAHPAFKNLPGKDPWGTFENSKQPVFKKLIPPEMDAMKLYTGKISGKCFTLVNLIISGFIQLGVHPDDIIVIITQANNARHAMAFVKYEGEVVLVNLMMVGSLKKYIQKDFKAYRLLGIYNFNISQKVDLKLTRDDVIKILNSDAKRLSTAFFSHYKLPKANTGSPEIHLYSRYNLYKEIFTGKLNRQEFDLSKYAYQSIFVKHPEYYLHASQISSIPVNLAKKFKSDDEVFEWIKNHIRKGSIFSDSDERIMTADQVLVFQQGSYKDQGVLAWTLLKHAGIQSELLITKNNAFLKTSGNYYDFNKKIWAGNISETVLIHMSL